MGMKTRGRDGEGRYGRQSRETMRGQGQEELSITELEIGK